MVRDTPSSQDASTHQIWNSYLKEYRRYAPDTKPDGRTDTRTDWRTEGAITICLNYSKRSRTVYYTEIYYENPHKCQFQGKSNNSSCTFKQVRKSYFKRIEKCDCQGILIEHSEKWLSWRIYIFKKQTKKNPLKWATHNPTVCGQVKRILSLANLSAIV